MQIIGLNVENQVVADVIHGRYISDFISDSHPAITMKSEEVYVFEVAGQSAYLNQARDRLLKEKRKNQKVQVHMCGMN